ncbi:MAG: rubredoxin [Hydrogenothermaceae bacterium]|nr:rubredoxin [Hydrogenothermaceae bacterium]
MKVTFNPKADKLNYKCRVCGYIYDPSKGDTIRRISPGVEFVDLPDNWRCPVCKYTKREFRVLKG